MSRKKLNNRKRIVIIVIIIIFFVILFINSLYNLMKDINIRNQDNVTIAYVYKLQRINTYKSTSHKAYVKYTIDDKEYNSLVSRRYNEGEYIPIYYDINNYTEITTDGEITKDVGKTFLTFSSFIFMLIIVLENKMEKKNKNIKKEK